MKIKREYIGVWRIREMANWDRDYIDLVAPGHLSVKQNGTGTFAFGAVEAEIDCRPEKFADREQLSFSFAGFDEGDEVSGRGWVVVDGNSMDGWFSFHLGDESTFKAARKKAK
jgi:hypothetical protein